MPRYRLSGVRVRAPQVPDETLLARLLGLPAAAVSGIEVVRRSLDARKKPDLVYEYAIEADLAAEPPAPPAPPLALEPAPPRRAPELLLPPLERTARVAVVGTGPAGLFAALALADAGVSLVVLERGDAAE